ncbi:YfgM family protein [Candidatus Ichthyocystis hellenicum]|uniref:YfgM family protein n=1 Tax=Candidatus Ichthyocystis hellenicum TaxID=1561003 RepID=UPI000B8756DE|nr:tetratricopeptide repeat protein [Candidatus Ichthyocystis hellenicum]
MDLYTQEEQEQIEIFRDVFRKYLSMILTILFVAVVGFSGHSFWSWYRNKENAQALSYYSLFRVGINGEDFGKSQQALRHLQLNFPSSPYSYLASLSFSAFAVKEKKTDDALSVLTWIIGKGEQPWATLAIVRAVPIAIDAKKYDMAKEFLSAPSLTSFKPLILMEQGDLEISQGRYDDAISLYRSASEIMSERAQLNNKSWGVYDSELQQNFKFLIDERVRCAGVLS